MSRQLDKQFDCAINGSPALDHDAAQDVLLRRRQNTLCLVPLYLEVWKLWISQRYKFNLQNFRNTKKSGRFWKGKGGGQSCRWHNGFPKRAASTWHLPDSLRICFNMSDIAMLDKTWESPYASLWRELIIAYIINGKVMSSIGIHPHLFIWARWRSQDFYLFEKRSFKYWAVASVTSHAYSTFH